MKRLMTAMLCGVALSATWGVAAYAQGGFRGLGDALKNDVNNAVQQEVQGATGKALGNTGAAADTASGAALKGAADDAGAAAINGAAQKARAGSNAGTAAGGDEPR